MKFLIFSLIAILCVSCTSLQHGETKFSAVGGRGVLKTKGQDGLAFAYDNTKSFRDLMVFLGVAASSGATAYTEAARSSVDKAAISADVSKHAATQGTIINAQNVGGQVVREGNAANVGAELAPAILKTPSGY